MESVWAQTYQDIELVVVDDGSTDGSAQQIRKLLEERPEIQFFENELSAGNCRAFNQGLKLCKGKYIIDLAADDVLLPQRVEEGVKIMEAAGEKFGVHFSDAIYIDVAGKELRRHYRRNSNGGLAEMVPQGWVYADVLQRYFICTPTMMMRRSVLDTLGGYDEALAYEDFDFWVRSARHWQYCFTDQVLVKKRVVPGSWSSRQYERESRQLESTLKVCYKAKELNQSALEDRALSRRLAYEIRQAIRSRNFEIALEILNLKKEIDPGFWENVLYRCTIQFYRRNWLKRIF